MKLLAPLRMWVIGLIGLTLLQSTLTGVCPAAEVFRWVGVKAGTAAVS